MVVADPEWTPATLKALLDAEFRALREFINERDLRYQQRFEDTQRALQAALAAKNIVISVCAIVATILAGAIGIIVYHR